MTTAYALALSLHGVEIIGSLVRSEIGERTLVRLAATGAPPARAACRNRSIARGLVNDPGEVPIVPDGFELTTRTKLTDVLEIPLPVRLDNRSVLRRLRPRSCMSASFGHDE